MITQLNRFKNPLFALILMLPIIVFGQSDRVAGKIRGKVYDANSNTPLLGANVVVLPTSTGRGSMTDEHGDFVIPNVLTGKYDLMVTYIGYRKLKVQGINVLPGQTVEVKFPLTVSALTGDEVFVIADANDDIVNVKSTVTQIKVSGEEISKMPVSDFTDIIASTGGVVETEGGRSSGIHIRGGRSGEIAYFVDGIHTPIFVIFPSKISFAAIAGGKETALDMAESPFGMPSTIMLEICFSFLSENSTSISL